VLVRLAYLAVSNAFAMVWLLPVGEREKDVEILVLRHQIVVLQRQLGSARINFEPEDRALLAVLLPGCLAACCFGCGWSFNRTPYCAGTATWSDDSMPRAAGARDLVGRVPSGQSDDWCCVWHAKMAAGAIDASRVSWPCSG
jgi:hypothetical protein